MGIVPDWGLQILVTLQRKQVSSSETVGDLHTICFARESSWSYSNSHHSLVHLARMQRSSWIHVFQFHSNVLKNNAALHIWRLAAGIFPHTSHWLQCKVPRSLVQMAAIFTILWVASNSGEITVFATNTLCDLWFLNVECVSWAAGEEGENRSL